MNETHVMKVIARIRSDFPTKFGIPRQSGFVGGLKSTVIFEPEYRCTESLKGLSEFTHIWLIWQFSESVRHGWSPTVRPPRLGGNKRVGVFASRSPFRPNAIGLSSVKLTGIENHPELGPVLHVDGADLMDNTPIYDIKPYIPHADSHPAAAGGFSDQFKDHGLKVECEQCWLDLIPGDRREALLGVLAQDPRPSYQKDPVRVYSFSFAGFEIKFTVEDNVLTVCDIKPAGGACSG